MRPSRSTPSTNGCATSARSTTATRTGSWACSRPTTRVASAAPGCIRVRAKAGSRSATGSPRTKTGRGYRDGVSAVLTRVGFALPRPRPHRDPGRSGERALGASPARGSASPREATLRRRLPQKQGSDLRDVNVWTMFRTELAGSPVEAYGYTAYDALGRRARARLTVSSSARPRRRSPGRSRTPASSEQRNAIVPATSSGCPARRSGTCADAPPRTARTGRRRAPRSGASCR